MIPHTLIACLCMVAFLLCAEGKVAHGKAKGHQLVYLNKFCYGYGNGTLNFTLTTSSGDTSGMTLLLVDDQFNNWTDIYKGRLTCEQIWDKSNHVGFDSGVWQEVRIGDYKRPHFWYASLFSCGEDIDIDYQFTFLQESNSKWEKQFSYDEIGLEGLYLFFFVLFIIGGVVHGYTVWGFLQTGSYHTIVRLFSIAIALEGMSVFCLFVHYAIYSANGEGAPGLKGVGDLMDITAQVVFILLIVLIAKGWCISKTTIDDRLVVLVGLGVIIASYLAMFIWVNVGLDPASTLYIYQTAPGIIIIVVRGIAMLWFVYSMRNTYMQENNAAKREFYLYFGIAYLVWFLSLPLVTAIAAGIDPWMRQKVVVGLYVTLNAVFLLILGFLLWPSRASEYFQISARALGSVPYDSI